MKITIITQFPNGFRLNRTSCQYENQMSVLGNWTAKGLPRPAWSNAGGKVRVHTTKNKCQFQLSSEA